MAALVVSCGPPPPPAPPTPQEALVQRIKPLPIKIAGGGGGTFGVGTEATFAEDTAIRIDNTSKDDKPHDLSKEAVHDAVSLAASSAADMEAFASVVKSAAGGVASVSAKASAASPSKDSKEAAERVRKQANGVRDGASKVEKVAGGVAGTLALIGALGSLLGTNDQKLNFQVAAETRGRPYRASCATTIHIGNLDKISKPSLSCVIVRADIVPVREWTMSVVTRGDAFSSIASVGKLVPKSVGSAAAAPAVAAPPPTSSASTNADGGAGAGDSSAADVTPFWFNYPDRSGKWWGSLDPYCFDAHRESGPPMGRLCGVDTTTSPTLVLDVAEVDAAVKGGDPESGDAITIGLTILSLLPWPDLHPKESDKK